MPSDRPEFTDEQIAGLTDSELVECYDITSNGPGVTTSDQYMQIEAEFRARPTTGNQARLETARRELTDPNARMRRLYSEIGERQGVMFKTIRLARDLRIKEVLTLSNVSNRSWLTAIEHGEWRYANASLYARACTEGGLRPDDEDLRNTFWPLFIDHPYCRTIREVAIDPDWLTANQGVALVLARTIRERRIFDLLPALADALERAGCVDRSILDHCRGSGFHIMSCWVVDALVRAGRRR